LQVTYLFKERVSEIIPAKLVSKRALIDLGYPFFEEVCDLQDIIIAAFNMITGQHNYRAEGFGPGQH
jgi:hypothetical protein